MDTSLFTSNPDEDCFLGAQSLAISESADDKILKDDLNTIMSNKKTDIAMPKDIYPNTLDESNSKYKTNENQILNQQTNLNSDAEVSPKHDKTKLDKQPNKFNAINTEDLKIDKSPCQIEINSKYLENSLNSDSDNQEISTCLKKRKCISYSDDEDFLDEEYICTNTKDEKSKKISSIIDSESEEDLHPNESIIVKNNSNYAISKNEEYHKKIATIIDPESDESNIQLNDGEKSEIFNFEETTNNQADYDKKPQQRASAKIALDTISAIKSETQRMHRENEINVPYHKPRNCTLKEFMARKSQDVLKNAATKSIRKGFSLKMTEEELENYAKYLEKREKESQDLFANEEETIPIPTTEDKDHNTGENIDNIQTDIEKPSKIEIISDILICPPEKLTTPALNISNLKKLLVESKDLVDSPILNGSSKFLIDLESGDMIPTTLETTQTPKSGFEKLYERFLKSSGSKKSSNTKNSAIYTENNETLNLVNTNKSLLDDTEFNNSNKDRKPGASYVALQNNLRKIIFESRKTVLNKKINDFKIENQMVEQICAEEDEEDDCTSEDDEYIEKDNSEIQENLDEENFDNNEDDNISENEEKQNEDADDESDDSINNQNIRNKKLSRRVIKRFDDDSDSDSGDYKFLNATAKDTNEIEINEKQEEELLELCSGKFDSTQNQSEMKVLGFGIPTTQLETQLDESQLEALCSGTFTDKISEKATDLISDEDKNQDELFKKPYSRKKTINKISYSDDEDNEKNDDINNFENDINTTNLQNYDDEEEEIETFIDYDSDENEVEVEMTKTDRKMRANDFVENEAELSESEWDSADEDEKDLDKYDIEIGDEDEFDQNELQSELGKIHMRKMMDDDARELKKMQELLFDDEETDGLGRQRQFRWRKTDNGFDINDNADGDLENKESGEDDDENEQEWRKMKHEREILLMEKQQLVEENKILLSPLKLQTFNQIDQINSPKILISKSKKSIDLKKIENDSQFLISKNNAGGIRGSFLKRDKETLSKVAANINADPDDNNGRVKTTTGKYNNFVFTILSQPQVQQTNKRKLSDNADIDTNKFIKKSKLISHKDKLKKNLIDHLDLTEGY